MATRKKNSYIGQDLKWLEDKAAEMKKYCDDNPISHLRDREVGNRMAATIEQQIKCIRDTLKDYIDIIAAIEELREKKEAQKVGVRGNHELSPLELKDI
jgi:hypothetical protein